MNGPVGLNYQSVEVILRIYEVKDPRKMFEEIALIEAGALGAFARQSEKRKAGGGT